MFSFISLREYVRLLLVCITAVAVFSSLGRAVAQMGFVIPNPF